MFEFFRRNWRPQRLKDLPQTRWAHSLAPQVRNLRAFSERTLGVHRDLVLKTVTTVITLAVIYYAVTTLVVWITAPRIDMTMSPVAGRIAVVAQPAKKGEIVSMVTYTGSISAYREVTVYPRVEGWVERFTLYEGDYVKKGDLIARLDRAELTAAVERAQAAVLGAMQKRIETEADIQAAEAGVVTAKAGLAEAEAGLEYWKKELPRYLILVKQTVIPQSDYDNAHRQAEAARARVEEQRAKIALAKAKLDQMRKRLKVIDAEIDAAEAEWERRKTILRYTDLHAPISGRVAKRHIYAGILVKPGMPIVDLQDLSRVRVQTRVAEKDLPHIKAGHIGSGTEVIVRFPNLPNPHNEFKAQVSAVFPQLDPVTRTATVEAVLSNPDGMIKPDMYAVMDLILERKKQAVIIPRLAVLEGPEKKPIVYVTDGVTAMSRPVKLGVAEGDKVEVLEGVKEGEMVVWRGQRSLSDGAEVNVVPQL